MAVLALVVALSCWKETACTANDLELISKAQCHTDWNVQKGVNQSGSVLTTFWFKWFNRKPPAMFHEPSAVEHGVPRPWVSSCRSYMWPLVTWRPPPGTSCPKGSAGRDAMQPFCGTVIGPLETSATRRSTVAWLWPTSQLASYFSMSWNHRLLPPLMWIWEVAERKTPRFRMWKPSQFRIRKPDRGNLGQSRLC